MSDRSVETDDVSVGTVDDDWPPTRIYSSVWLSMAEVRQQLAALPGTDDKVMIQVIVEPDGTCDWDDVEHPKGYVGVAFQTPAAADDPDQQPVSTLPIFCSFEIEVEGVAFY